MNLLNLLSGRKTYIIGAILIAYLFGANMQWWPADGEIIGLLATMGGLALRAGIAKAPAAVDPVPAASPTAASPLPILLALCGFLAMGATACRSPETTAYRTIATTAVTVDAAMNIWGDHVRAGRATADQETAIRTHYERYQHAVRATRRYLDAYGLVDADPQRRTINDLLDAIDDTRGDLIAIVHTFTRTAP